MADEVVTTEQAPGQSDAWATRFVIIALSVVLFICVSGIILLPFFGKEYTTELPNMATMIIGVLAAILSPMAARIK
jgi:hypothetical protein